ncbi:cysteine dioxygenase [Sneathiella sp.]|uniref:cysteine dioxygenase family protein n=1 Tax=Sneathiella sp. TaxID=1964365 RepID=UPI00356A29D3
MRTEERQKAITETVDRIRDCTRGRTIGPEVLDDIKQQLIRLAGETHLFSIEDFPGPEADAKRRSCLYRLSEDDDHGFALYLNVASGAVTAPPHNHTTWAVIAGIEGQEENRFYKKVPDGVKQTGSQVVEQGTAVALMPDDIHTIHIKEGAPVLNFHMYGRALEQLDKRNFWNDQEEVWKTFPAHTDIREARS